MADRKSTCGKKHVRYVFQSTPSVGRATLCTGTLSEFMAHFNPRPPWGGRPGSFMYLKHIYPFQSTPSVGRATDVHQKPTVGIDLFQSTPSVGRATKIRDKDIKTAIISIHALRGEGDVEYNAHHAVCDAYFNPRPPWGGRHSGRGRLSQIFDISIHALRGEGDASCLNKRRTKYYFNPRPPWGGRR